MEKNNFKKITNKLFLAVVACVLLATDNVYADSPSCYAQLNSNNTSVAVGEEFIYDVGTMGASSNTFIKSLHYIIEYDSDDLEVVEINGKAAASYNGWEINSNHNTNTGLRVNYVTISSSTNDISKMYNNITSKNFVKIAYIKFKVKTTKVTSTDIKLKGDESYYIHVFGDELESENLDNNKRYCYDTHTTVVNIYTKNSNTSLSSLTVNQGSLDSAFNKEKTTYDVIVENEVNTIQIDGTCAGKNCKISGTGLKELEVGENKFVVTVTAENGATKKYTLNVTRREKEEVFLKKLTISDLELLPTFDSSTRNYVVIIPYEQDKLDIDYILNNEKNTVKIIGNENLKVGKNEVTLIVSNEEETVITNYNLTVLKEEKEEIVTNNNYSKYYLIGLILLGLISIGELIIILKKRK